MEEESQDSIGLCNLLDEKEDGGREERIDKDRWLLDE